MCICLEIKMNFHFNIKENLYYLYYIFLLFSISVIFSYYLKALRIAEPIKTVVGTTEAVTAFSQSIFLLIGVLIAGLIVLFLFIKKRYFLIRYMYLSAFSLALFFIFILFLEPFSFFLEKFLFGYATSIVLLLSLFISSCILFGIFLSKNQILYRHSLMITACIIGTLIGGVFEFVQLAIFLIVLSIYDIFAVFLGPLGRLAKEINKFQEFQEKSNKDDKRNKISSLNVDDITRGMFLQLKNIDIGIGDLILYSALISNLFVIKIESLWAVLLSILIGGIITFKLAKKFGMFPGLPIPVFLSLGLIFLVDYFL